MYVISWYCDQREYHASGDMVEIGKLRAFSQPHDADRAPPAMPARKRAALLVKG